MSHVALIRATVDRRPAMSAVPTGTMPSPNAYPPAGVPSGHRRRWIVVMIAAAAALVLATSVGLYLVLRDGTGQPAGSRPAAQAPAATASPAPTASGAAGALVPPDGRIPASELRNATLRLPPWPSDNLSCQSGRVTFTNGKAPMPENSPYAYRTISINEVAYGDVDRDGARETVARIACFLTGYSTQVIAFDRDTAGRIVTLGTVVATTGPVRGIGEPVIRPSGVVAAEVADYQNCCGDDIPVQTQWRSYGWNGERFMQVGGPTTFPPNPRVTETAGSASDLVFDDGAAGSKYGKLTVRVTYLYGARPDHLRIGFYHLPADVYRAVEWPPVQPVEGTDGFVVDVPTPAIGRTATYTFVFGRPGVNSGGELTLTLTGMTAHNIRQGESNPYNGPDRVLLKG
jgi:hypothetical protein